MIKDPVTITINNSYDWSIWEKTLIEKCSFDNPSSLLTELAEKLNMSDRTLYRKVNEYKIDVDSRKVIGYELNDKYGKKSKNKA